MSSWRQHILDAFAPAATGTTLVADPDGLMVEEGVASSLHSLGYELIQYEDPVAFRYAFESRFRGNKDGQPATHLVIALRGSERDLQHLPFDVLKMGRKLEFSLASLFPGLSYSVVSFLDCADLDALYEAQRVHAPGQLGENATKEFILRHVFAVAPELIKHPADLLRVLLRRHYHNQVVPPAIDERLIAIVRTNQAFNEWPIELLARDREAFFGFLQERWPLFLDRQMRDAARDSARQADQPELQFDGPSELPFEHQDVRVYVDNLFTEGLLTPVALASASTLTGAWLSTGIQLTSASSAPGRTEKLLDVLEAGVPKDDAKHPDWTRFARGWAELLALVNDAPTQIPAHVRTRIDALRKVVDGAFSAWMVTRYAGLISLPATTPAMLHHIPRYIARNLQASGQTRAALIVIDGMSLEQWVVVRNCLLQQRPSYHFKEHSVFCWVPSLTSVSRQAVFAGRAPMYFKNSLWSTDKEPTLWAQFWAEYGFASSQVVYRKSLGDGNLEAVSELLTSNATRVAGLVIDKIDKIMHGMELGSAGMHNQVKQWADRPYLTSLLDLLLSNGYKVYITSDHGNVEATGCGRPNEGATADIRGARARVYSTEGLRRSVSNCFPDSTEWPILGLPGDCFALIAPAGRAFVQEHATVVCHGGVSIEEVVVPFVEVQRSVE